jgi:beta-exotoxin I transport system ATP-binding protein
MNTTRSQSASGHNASVTTADRSAIRVEALTKRYGSLEAVRGIDLDVRHGEVFGFVGPNGAGKSTTIRCLLDLIRPTSGRIEVLGLDPRAQGVEMRSRIAYVPGELRLPERMTSRQLVASIARLRGGLDDRRRDEVVERLGIDLDRRMRDLSTGNRRKVALLLAFAARAELLILDEPTSGLDPLMQHEFLGLVREARAAGTTIFLSSHVLSEVQRAADRVAVLKDGRVVVEGTVDELRGRARQRVEAWFVGDAPVEELRAVPGLVDPLIDGRRLSATLSGAPDPLLAVLARHPVASLVLEEPDLEDAFLGLYADAP